MKTYQLVVGIVTAAALLTACGNNSGDYDAAGVFETTEVIVSARGTGEIKFLNVEEGQTVKANQPLGELDMTQLVLKNNNSTPGKMPLQAAN